MIMSFHVPVLAGAVADWAAGSHRAVDATAGGGGHTALLRAAGAAVLAIDRDPAALSAARAALGDSGISWLEAPFASDTALTAVQEFRPDRILLDLGVSSHQLDDGSRGFSFRPGAPLDMRMTPPMAHGEGGGASAADLLNTLPEAELARIFIEYGDEPPARGRRLARAVVRRRLRSPFAKSDDLVNAIREVLGPRSGPPQFARLFQAVRITVNAELDQLSAALPAFRDALTPGGRLAVITYHSGEDRVVKHSFREWSRDCVCPPRQPVCTCRGRALGTVLTRRALTPDAGELADNPRARSAKFRAFASAGASDGA